MTDSGPAGSDRREDPNRSIGTRLSRALTPAPVRRRYALKFSLALFVVLSLITGIGVASYVEIREIVEEDAESALRSTATVQADAVEEWIAGMESQTRGTATSDVYGTGDRERIRDHLRDSRATIGSDAAGLHYVETADDEILASTDPHYEGASVSSAAPSWRATLEGAAADEREVSFSDRTYERNGELLVAFARPVRFGDGLLVVVADLRRAFEGFHGPETIGTARALNADGTAVSAPRGTLPDRAANTTGFEVARDGETAIHVDESDVVAFAPVEGTDWVVVAEAPKGSLYEASEAVGRNVVLLVTSTVVALGVVGLVLGRGTVLPLIRLRERAQALERGDFDVDLRTAREDEIGRLFVAFARMRDALRTQIRETEAARDRAEDSSRELARQNERLDQFASTVSHDLRNPLNVANGYRELLSAEVADGDPEPEAIREYATRIEGAHGRMETIIDDVLTLARDGERIDGVVAVDLEELATGAWSTVDHGDATLEVVGTRTFQADRNRLRRAFENLFRNAIEHGSDGDGPAPTVEVGPAEDGFYVADDGPGIPPELVDDVFEYGRTTTEDGTGLGLAIVDAIATAHGWTIAVDGTYDDGAKFVISGVADAEVWSRASNGPERPDAEVVEEPDRDEVVR